jgi:predicted ribosome-associated RNA-binding protein Tma20
MSGASSSRIVVPLSRGGFASSRDFRTAYATDKALGDEPEYTQAPMKRTKEIGVAPLQCFRKPITASGRVPLNGSASKKFRATVRGIFKAPSEEEFERLWPKKATVVSEKLSGAGLADVDHKPMVWWIRSDENPADKNDLGSPMFIDFSGGHSDTHMFYPTVYALSIVPNLLRPMYVHSGVSTYIVRGADCMWPGVISEPDAEAGVGRFQRGERRALVAAGNPVPFAVGWLDSDSASVIAAGRTGKALSIVHCWSDELWRLGNGVAPNIGFQKGRVYGIRTVGDEAVESEEEETEAVQKTTDVLAGVQISDGINVPDSWDNGASPPPAASEVASSSEAPPSSDAAPSTIGTSESVPTSDNAVAPAGEASLPADSTDAAAEDIDGASGDDEDDEDESSENRLSPAEMDAAMLQAFLYAVHLRLKDSDFPMDPSTLLSEMQLCHFHPTERLNPKRSSFKKLAKWLKDMQKRGLLKAKTGGGMQGFCSTDVTVMSVSRTSPLLKDVVLTKEVTDMMKRKEKVRFTPCGIDL